MMISRDDFVDFQEQGIPLPKTTHGGKRPGAGRPPRTDGRTNQVIVIMATKAEAQLIRQMMSTIQRRKVLLAAIVDHTPETAER